MPGPRKPRFSPTRIGTFLTCRAMYKFDYIDKIGRFYHKSYAGNSFGATLHQALHDFHMAGGAATEDANDLAQRAILSWRSAGFADQTEEQHYRDLAVTLLNSYHESEVKRIGQTRVFLAEKQINFDMGELILCGRVDRIDEHLSDGALEIIDYKSGRSGITAEDVENALAMCVYQLILKRMHPDRRVLASIHALRSNESATVELTDEQLAYWEDNIRQIAAKIGITEWESVVPIFMEDVCPSCDFLKVCDRYWKRQQSMDAPE